MRTRGARTSAVVTAALGLSLGSLTGCSAGSPTPDVDLAELSTPYPCGYGFQAGNDAGTVGLFLVPDSPGQPPRATAADLGDDGAWSGEIRIGRDLFANWCDDVIVMGEPQPEVDEAWTLVDGVVEITALDESARTATMTATDLVAVEPDGTRHDLGDVVLVNEGWGTFAG